jgi:predicted phage-related endonuclease
MAVERYDIKDREEWLRFRLRHIGASEVAICCGQSPRGSLAELYAEKKGLRRAKIDSGVLRRGRWGEATVFEALHEETKWEVARASVYYFDPELRIGATPDGFAIKKPGTDPGIIQAKTCARSIFRRRWLEDPDSPIEYGDADCPIYYKLQTLTEMMLTECRWGVVAVVVQGEFDSCLRLFDIQRDPEIEALIKDNVATFWREYFDPGIMPDFEPQRDEKLIKALFPKDIGTTIDLSRDNLATALVDDLTELQRVRKKLDKDERAIKTELTGKLNQHSYGTLADGRVISWKLQHRSGYAVQPSDYRVLKILKAHPEAEDDESSADSD